MQKMPNYPVPYQNNFSYGGVGQQMYGPQYPQMQQQSMIPAQTPGTSASSCGLIWVDGEVGAKAFQMPNNMPANQPVALWDTNDTVIYLKSVNPMGMPNPLQKAHYTLDENKSGVRNSGYSGDAEKTVLPDLSDYVRKEDMERMKRDLMDAINSVSTSGSNNNGNRRPNQKGDN